MEDELWMNGDWFAWSMIKEGTRWFVGRYGVPLLFLGLLACLAAQAFLTHE